MLRQTASRQKFEELDVEPQKAKVLAWSPLECRPNNNSEWRYDADGEDAEQSRIRIEKSPQLPTTPSPYHGTKLYAI
jgi:hypothetical protein